MKQRRRIYYSAAQRAEIWDRWRRGEVDARHRPLVRSRPFLDLLGAGAERGHSTAAAATITAGLDPCRARGDFTWPGRGAIASLDGASARAFAFDDQPRDRAQWRSQTVPGGEGRQARLAICAASKAMQVGAACLVAASCCGKARLGMVSSADRGLAEVDKSEKRGASGVARNHLS